MSCNLRLLPKHPMYIKDQFSKKKKPQNFMSTKNMNSSK